MGFFVGGDESLFLFLIYIVSYIYFFGGGVHISTCTYIREFVCICMYHSRPEAYIHFI